MTILLFGITRDIVGNHSLNIPENDTKDLGSVGQLKSYIMELFPALKDLTSLAVAVNSNYASDKTPISGTDEIALIPPVSGG
ncbi:MAG: MoaD/ThiS family protein [Eudoraea sp.]|nr:MoaD/ThiS family protein [Eudoraea sp.]